MDVEQVKKDLATVENSLSVLRAKGVSLQEELDVIHEKTSQVEGVAMYLRGKLVDAGEVTGTDAGGTLPDLKNI